MNHDGQKQAHSVHYDVPFASGYLLARVIASGPPFSVVFTDWLSMMAALGRGLPTRRFPNPRPQGCFYPLPSPSSRHLRKYHHTVPPRRQVVGHHTPGNPPRSTYRMPLTTSRRSVSGDGLWWYAAAVKEPILPTGHRSNRWDKVFYSCYQCNQRPILTPRTIPARLAHCHTPSKHEQTAFAGTTKTKLLPSIAIVQ